MRRVRQPLVSIRGRLAVATKVGVMALKGRVWVGVCAVAVAAALLGIQPAGAQAQVAPTCDASSYSLALQSLTGPPRADLVIRITAKVPGCELPESLSAQVTLLPF